MSRPINLLWAVVPLLLPGFRPAIAGSPATIFGRVVPHMVTVEALGPNGEVLSQHSAINMGKARALTVCEDLARASALRVANDTNRIAARLVTQDGRRNLCLVEAPGLTSGRSLEIRREVPEVGARVYAVSNAMGLGMGITEGLLAGVRHFPSGTYLQFSAAVSPGSQGGALVDDGGRLIGIIEYRQRSGQNINFAAPASWITEIEARAPAAQDESNLEADALAAENEERWSDLDVIARRWIDRFPDSVIARRYEVRAAAGLGDANKIEAGWRALLALEPASREARLGLGMSLIRQGRAEAARQFAQDGFGSDPEDASLWLIYGAALSALGEDTDAALAFRRAAQFDPWLIPAHTALAGLATKRGDYDEAGAIWSRLSGLYPDESAFVHRQVQAALLAGEPERAYRTLAAMTGNGADAAETWYWRGVTARKLGRPLEAIEALKQSVARSPQDAAQAWSALASIYHDLRRHPEAIDAARKAVALEPDSDDAKFWLAIQLKDGGHPKEALATTAALVQRMPDNANFWRAHGITLCVLGQYAEARPALQKSLLIEPRQGKVWAALIDSLYATGDVSALRQAYSRLKEIDPVYAKEVEKVALVVEELRP